MQNPAKKGEGEDSSIWAQHPKNELRVDSCIPYSNICMSLKYMHCPIRLPIVDHYTDPETYR